jgi:hypothetical protein
MLLEATRAGSALRAVRIRTPDGAEGVPPSRNLLFLPEFKIDPAGAAELLPDHRLAVVLGDGIPLIAHGRGIAGRQ